MTLAPRALPLLAAMVLAASCASAPVATAGLPSASPAAASPSLAPTPTPTASPSETPVPSASAAPDWSKDPVAADDPGALAQQLVMVEQAIRDPKVTGPHLVWMGHLEQLIYSRLADYPDWKAQVLAGLTDPERTAVAASLDAGKELRTLQGPIPKDLPDWQIVEPAPPEQLMSYYREAEQKYGVPWYYLASINLVESRMGRIRGLSSGGAQGPMQFIASTWAQYGTGDVNDPHAAILAAGKYLKAAGAPGDMAKALYAYNHAEAYVKAIEGYADVMKADPNAFRGYYGWQVYFPTKDGPLLLAVGWKKADQ
ncbi:MAG: lytic transglycosylase domain-containing protein [Chloroflexota bacterium]|nr:lytic transglycosylase domain-containing protein [Chloroflexota bacterium]